MTDQTPQASRPVRFAAALDALPLVAILRGITPAEAEAIGEVLQSAGFRLIEVPLNSPEPFRSIERLRHSLPPSVLVGAGTVRRLSDIEELSRIGADVVVMPHGDADVIRCAHAAGMLCIPGVATATEAFAAIDEGVAALKLFPAEMVTPAGLKALRAVVPATVPILPVGGIVPESMARWRHAGATGFGLGSALYTPGKSPADVAQHAREFANCWRGLAI